MSVVKPVRWFSVVSLVAWLDGHEASPHDRAAEAELRGCVSEIRSLRCTMTWPRSVAGVARLLGRDQVSDPHGCVLEARRLICTVACSSARAGRLIRTVAWPRSGDWFARLLARDARETDPHDCVAEISCWHCTVTWPRSGACVARLLGRDPKVARAWVFECLCV